MTTRIAIFCSGKGTHLQTIEMAMAAGLDIEPVFFFTNNPGSSCYSEALKRFPKINAMALSHTMFNWRHHHEQAIRAEMDEYDIDLVLFLGYMRVVTSVFLEGAPPIINIHPSLLPAFKGSRDALRDAVDYGCKVTGCTAHYVTVELDDGPIIAQSPIHIFDGMSMDHLRSSLQGVEKIVLIKAIKTHLGIEL